MKKILAIVLVLLMALQLAPFAASAEELTHDHDHEEESAEAAVPEEEPAAEEPAPEDGEEIPAEIPEAEPAPTETDLRSLEIPAPEPAAAAEPDAVPAAAEPKAVSAPTGMWLAPSEASGIPSRIDVYVSNTQTSGTSSNRTYTYTAQLYLPGNAVLAECCLSWDGGAQATVDSATVDSGSCPIPAVGATKTYTIKVDRTTYVYKVTAYQGSSGVTPVFIEIDESQGTIANMKKSKDNTCSGIIFIGGQQYGLTKMKGRGNASWDNADDKKPYNLTLDTKIKFPGLDSSKTKKWSFLAEVLDRSLLCNRIGFHMAYEMGIGQDTASADVWMNGEYQGCYTVTPKTDSFVSKTGYMVEQDNYKEPTIANGGDPQFTLEGRKESSGWSSCYNRITVKKMGDDFLGYDANGEPDESVANLTAKAEEIQSWLQDAWDAIRSADGYNSKGKYYTDYIDIESFAKMYLMHEYDKNYDVCAGSILFYRNGTADTDKLYAGPIWDLDNSMGSCCRNDRLGKADDRSNGDRRSAQGKFIDNITEYKTSIYKTLYTHQDFKDEVQFQYNRYRDQFDALDTDLQQLIDEIADSAAMNYKKVNDIGNGQYQNLHYYSSATTLGSGNYRQSYVATTEWSKYAANLKTYLTYRSKWFRQDSGFYDPDFVDPATCEHQYAEVIDPAPTCTADGLATYTCPICKDSYKVVLPKIPHDYQNGACTVCGEVLVTAAISCTPGASVTVYETQSLESPHVDNAAEAHPRNGDTGLIDCAGDGQINFVVHLQEGFVLDGVSAAPKNYKNLKPPADTGIENGYRLTKVTGDLTITVTAHCEHDYTAAVTEPTCNEPGYTTYTCRYCGDSYTGDEVPALGHDWNDPTYSWSEDNLSVTASRVCSRDASHTETETVRTTSEVTKQPTCEEKGETTYTAAFTNSAFTVQTKTVDDINATGHTPGTPVKENEKAPTCTAAGSYDEVTYCTVCRKELNRETKTVPATGHEWNAPTYEWASDNSTATAKRVCAHDASHEEKETVKTSSEVTKEPTCTEPGETTWTAAFTNKAFAGQTKTEANIPALGHEPCDPVTENAVPATEEADGCHDEVVYCARCGAELSRTTVTDKYVKPEFRSQSLVLSGQIGLNFFLELPELEGVDYGESYMEFTVGKDPAVYRDAFDPDDTNSDGTRYGFTCYVNSIQMADTITATFHYGDGKTAVKEYSVAQYIEFFDEHAGDFSEKTIALIHAIADYGHYEQIFLAEVNGWTVGDKYAEMKACYTDPYDYAAILAAVEDKAFVKTLDGSGVSKASYKLHLDSETTVDVFLTAESGVTLTASAEFGGKTYEAVKQNDGRYLVRIPGISAHQLGDMITITGNAGGAFTVKVSALSYTRSVLNSGTAGKAAKDGVSALYAYYAAVLAYRA